MVRSDGDRARYRIGPCALELAASSVASQGVRRLALPFLYELAETSAEIVNLAVHEDGDVICIEQIESSQVIRAVNWVGRRLMTHSTAAGKAWLAYQRDAVVDTLIGRLADERGRLPACTEYTITDPDAPRRELGHVRRLGYALAHEELSLGLAAAAAPVFDHQGEVVATMAVSGPPFRLPPNRMSELREITVRVAKSLSAELGFPGASRGAVEAA